MRYVVLLAHDPGDRARADEATRERFIDDHEAFERFVDEHGRRVAGAALADADLATTLRRGADGQVVVSDGPYADTVEQVGGYYEVELPDLDSAIAAARLLPRQYTLEIRPTVQVEGHRVG